MTRKDGLHRPGGELSQDALPVHHVGAVVGRGVKLDEEEVVDEEDPLLAEVGDRVVRRMGPSHEDQLDRVTPELERDPVVEGQDG